MDRTLDDLINAIDDVADVPAVDDSPVTEEAEDLAFEVAAEEDIDEESPADDEPVIEAASEEDEGAEDDVLPDSPLVAGPESTDDVAEMQRRLVAQNDWIARWQQQQQMARAQQQVAALRARWAEMDPADAHREELQFLASNYGVQIQQYQQQLAQIERQRQYEREQADEAAAKPAAINRAIDYYKLSKNDYAILDTAFTAEQLDALARNLKQQRIQQTAAARAQRAAQVAGNPALTGGGGGSAVIADRAKPRNIDEFVDQLFAD